MNILTFDIEEWFHILDNKSTKTIKEWSNYESRIHENMNRILDLLDSKNQRATFFCLGWIAEKYPEVIREIDHRGFEIGSHTYMHQLIYEQNREEFSQDISRSIIVLEDIIGKKVRSFRAPGFSLTSDVLWAFEVLIENGITHDSSIFPAPRAHGGISDFGSQIPHILSYQGSEILEFPINTRKVGSFEFVYSGGGYFRLFPYSFLKNWIKQDDYVMTYFHPRDFDFNQPLIKDLSLFRRFKSYYGLKGAFNKLEKWIEENKFVDMETASEQIDWSLSPKVVVS